MKIQNAKNLMSILRGNDVGINVDIGPGEELAKSNELIVRLGASILLSELRRRLGSYRGGNL